MTKELDILISDKTFNTTAGEVIISKPKWADVNKFIAIIESYFKSYFEINNDYKFTQFLLTDGAEKSIKDIELIIAMCLRKIR